MQPVVSNAISGYDTGYISSVLVTIGKSLGHELSSNEQELVTSLTSGGALVSAIGAGLIADRFGRKMPIWVACVPISEIASGAKKLVHSR